MKDIFIISDVKSTPDNWSFIVNFQKEVIVDKLHHIKPIKNIQFLWNISRQFIQQKPAHKYHNLFIQQYDYNKNDEYVSAFNNLLKESGIKQNMTIDEIVNVIKYINPIMASNISYINNITNQLNSNPIQKKNYQSQYEQYLYFNDVINGKLNPNDISFINSWQTKFNNYPYVLIQLYNRTQQIINSGDNWDVLDDWITRFIGIHVYYNNNKVYNDITKAVKTSNDNVVINFQYKWDSQYYSSAYENVISNLKNYITNVFSSLANNSINVYYIENIQNSNTNGNQCIATYKTTFYKNDDVISIINIEPYYTKVNLVKENGCPMSFSTIKFAQYGGVKYECVPSVRIGNKALYQRVQHCDNKFPFTLADKAVTLTAATNNGYSLFGQQIAVFNYANNSSQLDNLNNNTNYTPPTTAYLYSLNMINPFEPVYDLNGDKFEMYNPGTNVNYFRFRSIP